MTHASRILDEILNRAPNRNTPYVGEVRPFAHKGGIHVSAVQEDRAPMGVCRRRPSATRRRLLVSDQARRSNILAELERIGIAVQRTIQRFGRCCRRGQGARAGSAYEAADASFALFARRMLGNVPQFFDMNSSGSS